MRMHYSRRELYAAGEPIGDSATYRKADGGLVLGDGGGGGGNSPVQQQTTISDLPDWAKGYAQDTLAKGKALTNTPYQAYGGERIAGFTPMQQQAFRGAANLAPTAQTAMGSGLAAAAGAGGLGTQYQAGNFSGGQFSPMAAGQYMSPFVQQALEPQLREATRQSAIMGQQNAAQAAQRGAFGGSRSALMESERQRNLGTQLSDITGKGYQTAYEQAANQFNQDMARRMQAQQLGEQSRQFGANLGMQGLQTGLQAAGALGNLGQQQFAQQQGAIQAQSAAGAQEQAQTQKGLDTAYQDYLTQLNYPYQQLSFMSNLIRGTPMGMNTQSQVYQAAPTTMQNLGALGLGAYGLSKMMADGGLAHAYAGGGSIKGYAGDEGSVTDSGLGIIDKFNDESRMLSGMHGLPDEELQQIVENPTTPAEGAAARKEINRRQEALIASERNGMAGAYNQLPYSTQQRMVRVAGGGILAFSRPTAANNYSSVEDPDADTSAEDAAEDQLYSPGISANAMPVQLWRQSVEAMMADKGYTPMTAKQRDAAELASYKRMQAMGGDDPYGPMAQALKQQDTDRLAALEQGKGLAALAAIPAILQPGGTIRGIGAAGAAFGGAYGQALQADRAEKRYLGQMQFHLADAKRKENMGLYREARQDVRDAEAAGLGAAKARTDRLKGVASSSAAMARAMRPTGGSGGAGKIPQVDRQAAVISDKIAELEAADPNHKDLPLLKKQLEGRLKIIGTGKDIGPNKLGVEDRRIVARLSEKAMAEANKQANSEAVASNLDLSTDAGRKAHREIYARRYRDAMAQHKDTMGMSTDDMIDSAGGMPEPTLPSGKPSAGGSGKVGRSNW